MVLKEKKFASGIKLYWWNSWAFASILVLALVLMPMITIGIKLFDRPGDQWDYIVSTLLSDYFSNTFFLVTGVAVVTFMLGVGCSWLVSTYEFPGRKYFEWLLILPLAFPSYILAYSYVGLFEYTGPLSAFCRNYLNISFTGPVVDIMNLPGAVFIMSISLFPYVYVLSRTSFLKQSRDMQEASIMLNSGPLRTFLKIALPMARPAIAAGIALVSMEVLNDYGTVKYFGVNTFTVGIFRAWFSLGDINTAIYLSAIMSVFVILLVWLEHFNRGKKAWSKSNAQNKPIARIYPRFGREWIIVAILSAVFLISFIMPISQLLFWVSETYRKVVNIKFLHLILGSFSLAGTAAVIIAVLSIILLYALRLNPFFWMRSVTRLASMGYAIPGAVIAVGVMLPLVAIDRYLIKFGGPNTGLILSGSLIMVSFAYVVRYLAVGYNAIDAGFQKTGIHVNEISRLLGAGNSRTFWKVDLPLIKKSVSAAILLTFVDLLKELPLTLILRPFNFQTLATQAFDLATNEMIAESANASLVIVLTGIIPVILLNFIITGKD